MAPNGPVRTGLLPESDRRRAVRTRDIGCAENRPVNETPGGGSGALVAVPVDVARRLGR